MATYKVLQDIEAEDKILGPLTLKQFIFGIIAIGLSFAEFKLLTTSGLGPLRVVMMLVILPPLAVFGFLAAPIGRDQPNDIWLLARLRYLLKPHKRIWNQDGMSHRVTITVPKKNEQQLTNNLSQQEVKSRLQALASTLDTRGWAVKNVDANTYRNTSFLHSQDESERLISTDALMSPINDPAKEEADMLDPSNNPAAKQLEDLVRVSEANHRQQVIQSMQQPAAAPQPANDYWFLQGSQASPQGATVAPNPAVDFSVPQGPAPTITTTHPQPAAQSTLPSQPATAKPQTTPANPAIIDLAHNDDLNVATIARQAHRIDESDGEVVVSLH